MDVPMLRGGDSNEGHQSALFEVRAQGGDVKYSGIDRCDVCGRPLEEGRSLSGICAKCEAAAKDAKRPVETVKPTRGIL